MTTKRRKFNDADRLQLINEYLVSGESKEVFQAKRRLGHSVLSRWMLNFGISEQTKPIQMPKTETKNYYEQQLQDEINRLKKELEYEKLRSKAFETMISVAEEELKVDIRKKHGAKQ